MSLLRLRAELRAVRIAVNELRAAIENHSEAVHAAEEARSKEQAIPKRLPVTISYDEQGQEDQKRYNRTQQGIEKWTRRAVIAAAAYAGIAALTLCAVMWQAKDFEGSLNDTRKLNVARLSIENWEIGKDIVYPDTKETELKFDIWNRGNSMAIDVEGFVSGEVYPASLDHINPSEFKESIITWLTKPLSTNREFAFNLGAGDHRTLAMRVPADASVKWWNDYRLLYKTIYDPAGKEEMLHECWTRFKPGFPVDKCPLLYEIEPEAAQRQKSAGPN